MLTYLENYLFQHLKHFHKKKGCWVEKEFRNKQVIWEMIMNKEDFLRMLDKLYCLEGIPIQVNISKLVKIKQNNY